MFLPLLWGGITFPGYGDSFSDLFIFEIWTFSPSASSVSYLFLPLSHKLDLPESLLYMGLGILPIGPPGQILLAQFFDFLSFVTPVIQGSACEHVPETRFHFPKFIFSIYVACLLLILFTELTTHIFLEFQALCFSHFGNPVTF